MILDLLDGAGGSATVTSSTTSSSDGSGVVLSVVPQEYLDAVADSGGSGGGDGTAVPLTSQGTVLARY